MPKFSSLDRNKRLEKMGKDEYDIIIIGGGITGAGIALDAVNRGMKTALIEMQDFAGGTSSRSTKLIHGGLRYLQQLEVKMVAEVGREREIVYENGPHVTTPEWMLLPFYKGSSLGPITTNIGLTIYDLLAGVKRTERRKMLNPQKAIAKEALIKQQGLKGAGFYVEYKTDDARLTIEVLKKAVLYGADAINHVKVTDLKYVDNEVRGVIAEDQISKETHEITGKKIINATGPWVDTLREVDGSKEEKTLLLTKGVHLVFDQSEFPLQQAIYFDSPDGRMIFAIPRAGKTYVGTTDTVYEGDLVNPIVTTEDRVYLLQAIDYIFPSLHLKQSDIESSWAGLRPLISEEGKNNPGEISRKDEIFLSDSGLISIAGGKLTGYRKMAEQVMDKVSELLKVEEGILYSKSSTKLLPISGGEVGGSVGFQEFMEIKLKEARDFGLTENEADQLVQTYGANVDELFKLYKDNKMEAADLKIEPVLFAMLIYAIENEAVYKPSDFFVQRTGALFFNINLVKNQIKPVVAYMAKRLNWTPEQKSNYTTEMSKLLKNAVTFN